MDDRAAVTHLRQAWRACRAAWPRTVVCLVLAAASAACAAREPWLVTIPEAGARPVRHIDAIQDYRTAVASISNVLERDLGFPPFPVTFYLYPDRAAFERALIAVGYEPEFARTTARTMTAVGGHRGVLLNEGNLAIRSWTQRTLLLAHELAHSLQYELGGGRRGTSDQWLREGFAEWLSVRVLDRLDGMAMAAFRRHQHGELRAAGRANVPPLRDMVTFRQWVEIGSTRGPAAYAFSFLAVEFLVEQHGMPAVVDYFSRFAVSQDRTANFHAAFGQDLHAFEAAVLEHVW